MNPIWAPAESGRNVAHDRFEHRGVVIDAELAGHGQENDQHRISFDQRLTAAHSLTPTHLS